MASPTYDLIKRAKYEGHALCDGDALFLANSVHDFFHRPRTEMRDAYWKSLPAQVQRDVLEDWDGDMHVAQYVVYHQGVGDAIQSIRDYSVDELSPVPKGTIGSRPVAGRVPPLKKHRA